MEAIAAQERGGHGGHDYGIAFLSKGPSRAAALAPGVAPPAIAGRQSSATRAPRPRLVVRADGRPPVST